MTGLRKYFALLFFVFTLSAQTVEQSIKLSEFENLKGTSLKNEIELLDLKMRDLRMQLFTLQTKQLEKIGQLREYSQFVLAERFLNGKEYAVDWDNGLITKSTPTPKEASNLPKPGEN